MKRDARIGLAVVLVLGLSVTLLVARALHQRANEAEELETAAAPASSERSVASTEQPANPENDPSAVIQQQELDRWMEGRPNGASEAQPAPVNNGNVAAPAPQPNANSTTPPRADVVEWNGQPNGNPVSVPQPVNGATLQEQGAPPVAEAAPEPASYTIVAGDNPYKISAKLFGDGRYAKKIMDANPGVDPNRLKVGQKLKVPALQGAAVAQPVAHNSTALEAVPNVAPVAAGTYTVKNGDTLAAIAKTHLGSSGPKSIQKILDANPGVDARKLKVGATLKIPAAAQ